MNNHKLLKLAAEIDCPFDWNSLENYGQILRLAVKLNILVGTGQAWTNGSQQYGVMFGEDLLQGEMQATCRAVVRAAASLPKHKEQLSGL